MREKHYRMAEKIKKLFSEKRSEILIFGVNLSLLIVFFGGLAHNQYNADTVFFRFQDRQAAVNVTFEEGRYLLGLIDILCNCLSINVANHIGIVVLINLILFATTLTINYLLFEDKKIDYAIVICLGFTFMNVYFSEVFMFGESLLGFGLGYLFASFAVFFFSRKKKILCVLYLLIAVCFYQYTMIYAAIMVLFVVENEHHGVLCKESFRGSFWGCFICVFVCLLNFMSSKLLVLVGLLSAEKIQQEQQISFNLIEKVEAISRNLTSTLLDGYGLMSGRWIALIVTCCTVLTLFVIAIRQRDWNNCIYLCLLITATFVLMVFMPSVRVTFDNPPRMAFSFFMIQGLFLSLGYRRLYEFEKTTNRIGYSYAYQGIIILYLLVQLFSVQKIVNNRYVSNTIDRIYTELMYQEIQRYENENDIYVSKLSVINDSSVSDYYDSVSSAAYSINERVLGKASWSIACDVSGRVFERVEMDPSIYETYFAGKNWDEFNLDEQLVIDGDTAYWCIY